MSAEPYVPPKIGFVRAEMHTGDGAWKNLTEVEFDRFIAKIKADAIREAANEFWSVHLDDSQKEVVRKVLRGRAERIEGEA